MKSILMLLVFAVSLNAQADDSLDFSRPPFWMPSASEMAPLHVSQIDFYVQGFVKIAEEIPALHGMTKIKVLEAMDRPDAWKGLMTHVYRACEWEKQRYADVCERAADLRVNMLLLRGNMKAENREAMGIREPDAEEDSKEKSDSPPKSDESDLTPESPAAAPEATASQKPS